MAKLSVIIPSRDEQFLIPTLDDIFAHARGEIEVVAVIDSDKWPGGWKEVTDRHSNLHTVHHGAPRGMRSAINSGVASATSRGADYIMKLDGHCSLSEGFDVTLLSEIDNDWVVVPRRGRLDPENWCATETHKPDIDYHYLSFPDDPNDFGGPGLNGKPWAERAVQRKDVLVDEELSSQGSCWLMAASYFQRLELMDQVAYGPFWSEFQEIGLKCWLSGGRVMVNKKAKYLHLHKGKKYGRGYRLEESSLVKGRNHTMLWPWNEAWAKQTLPFEWLIDRFWPVPGWREDWRDVLYRERKPRVVPIMAVSVKTTEEARVVADREIALSKPVEKQHGQGVKADDYVEPAGLVIHDAYYGIKATSEHVNVTTHLQSLVKNDSLDIVVNNSTVVPGQNPYRGKKKTLTVFYRYDDGPLHVVEREEKEWLIIGQAQPLVCEICGGRTSSLMEEPNSRKKVCSDECGDEARRAITPIEVTDVFNSAHRDASTPTMKVAALNDYLIRKFSISPQRLRAPMPIELRDFHRNDLAQLFAELGFRNGVEVGVAEGRFSEVLVKTNPDLHLICCDPWHAYSDNPQNKTKEKHEFAYNEAKRRLAGSNAVLNTGYSMDLVRGIKPESLDFCYIDGNHLFDYVMQDLIEWSKRVRSGGIVSGDDYYQLDQKRWVGGGVVEAVQAYVNAHRISPWFLFAGHKSVDFMFVKP